MNKQTDKHTNKQTHTHTHMSCCTEVDPISLSDYCSANLIRFAQSEREYLSSLHASVTNFMSVCPRQDNTALGNINAPLCKENLFDVPSGNISNSPLLVNLLDAFNLPGTFSDFRLKCSNDPARNWILDYQGAPNQKAFLQALCVDNKVHNMGQEMH